MAAAHQATTGYTPSSASTTHDITHTILAGSDRCLIVPVSVSATGGAAEISSVVLDPGGGDEATFTQIGPAPEDETGVFDLRGGLFYLEGGDIPTSGSYTVRITLASSQRACAAVGQYSGVDLGVPTNYVVYLSSGAVSSMDLEFTSERDGSLVYNATIFQLASDVTITWHGAATQRVDVSDHADDLGQLATADETRASAGKTDHSMSASSSCDIIRFVLEVPEKDSTAPNGPQVVYQGSLADWLNTPSPDTFADTDDFLSQVEVVAGSARKLVVALAYEGANSEATTISGVTLDPGGGDEQAFTEVIKANTGDTGAAIFEIAEADLPAVGLYDLQVSWSQSVAENVACVAHVVMITTADQDTPTNTDTDAQASASASSLSLTTGAANSLVVSVAAGDDDKVPFASVYGGVPRGYAYTVGNTHSSVCVTEVRPTATNTPTITHTQGGSAPLAAVAAEYKLQSVGGGGERGIGRGVMRGVARGI